MQASQTMPAPPASDRTTFFRQSGWLMIANIGSGALMWAVHFLSKAIPEGQYGNFGAFVAVIMVLPTIPLQMVLAQQTARCLAEGRHGELSGIIRFLGMGVFLVWLVGAGGALWFQKTILTAWKVDQPMLLYLTLLVVLFSILLPLFWGSLQGKQNFFWLGWSMMANGIGRFAVAALAVLAFHAYAAGMLTGVLSGVLLAFVVGVWQTRSLWLAPAQPFQKGVLLRQLLPLVFGFLGFQILFTADTMFVKAYFDEAQAGFYVGAGTLSRALMWFVLPLAAVMFPRIVHSAARSEKTNLLGVVMMGTAILAAIGAASLAVLGPWVVRIVFKESFVEVATSLLPWYAGAMVPLAMANVLLNNLLARPDAKLSWGIGVFVLALLFMFAMTRFHDELTTIPKVMSVFNTLLLGLCAWITWGLKPIRIGTAADNQPPTDTKG